MTTKLVRFRHVQNSDHNHSRPGATHTRAISRFVARGSAASHSDTLTVSVAEDVYLQRLRGLGAWWRLGSSALEPLFLVHYAPVRPPTWARAVHEAEVRATEQRAVVERRTLADQPLQRRFLAQLSQGGDHRGNPASRRKGLRGLTSPESIRSIGGY